MSAYSLMKYKIDRTDGEQTQFEIVATAVEQERLRALKALLTLLEPQSAAFASCACKVDCIEGTWTSSNSDAEAVANDIWSTLQNEFGLDCRTVLGDQHGNILNGNGFVVAGRYLAKSGGGGMRASKTISNPLPTPVFAFSGLSLSTQAR